MSNILEGLLKAVSDWNGKFTGAFNIRENGECAGRQSTKNIRIESKTDKPGLDIRIRPGTKGETVSIPACVTHGGVDDLVYAGRKYKLTTYRIEQLEQKVAAHNSLVERTYKLEGQMTEVQHDIRDLKSEVRT